MGHLKILFFGALFVAAVSADICSEEIKEDDCVGENFGEYQKCIEEVKSKRVKRQAVCPYTVQVPPCQQQYTSCLNNCQLANQVQIQAPTQCQQSCTPCNNEVVVKEKIIETLESEGKEIRNVVNSPAGHNITTVIHLNNIVNNTNILNFPTNLNTTNVNHINIIDNRTSSVTSSTTGGKYDLGFNEKGSCCHAVEPKSCRKSSSGPRCHHRRHKTCGSQCTGKVIHVQSRRKCNSSQHHCKRRRVHVPQPASPRCVHTRNWPYVSCGGRYQSSCDGCYDHYGHGYEGYYESDSDHCSGCYDDGFDIPGPIYRRGPVLRPYYYHEPPCYITGECISYYHTPYGYYGDETIDPAFPDYDEPHSHRGYDDNYENDYEEREYVDDIDDEIPEEFIDDVGEESLGIEISKCRVLEDDNTITIRNCTANSLQNPYIASPIERTRSTDQRTKRKRHSVKRSHSYEHRRQPKKRMTQKHQFPEEDDNAFSDDEGDFYVVDQ